MCITTIIKVFNQLKSKGFQGLLTVIQVNTKKFLIDTYYKNIRNYSSNGSKMVKEYSIFKYSYKIILDLQAIVVSAVCTLQDKKLQKN